MTSISRPLTRITVLISGSGTNLQALIDACITGKLPDAQIVRVISNRSGAYGLTRAINANIPTSILSLAQFKIMYPDDVNTARQNYDRELARLSLADTPNLVVCAGFMHILSPVFLNLLETAQVPIINLHPALPGEFPGIKAIERAHAAWKAGQISKTGIMVHYVIAEVDMGQTICHVEVPFEPGTDDDLTVFTDKMHRNEWQIIVQGTKLAIDQLSSPSLRH